jgi:hypothetical protein
MLRCPLAPRNDPDDATGALADPGTDSGVTGAGS